MKNGVFFTRNRLMLKKKHFFLTRFSKKDRKGRFILNVLVSQIKPD